MFFEESLLLICVDGRRLLKWCPSSWWRDLSLVDDNDEYYCAARTRGGLFPNCGWTRQRSLWATLPRNRLAVSFSFTWFESCPQLDGVIFEMEWCGTPCYADHPVRSRSVMGDPWLDGRDIRWGLVQCRDAMRFWWLVRERERRCVLREESMVWCLETMRCYPRWWLTVDSCKHPCSICTTTTTKWIWPRAKQLLWATGRPIGLISVSL